MLRMYQEFYEPALEANRQQQTAAHGATDPTPYNLGLEQMSIDEHLSFRSLPSPPPPWLSGAQHQPQQQQQPQQEFRHPQETDMLRLGQPPKMHLPHQAQTSTGCLQQAMNGSARCDHRVPSSSDTSSSSCSPSSSENVHAGIQNDPSTIVNHAMKPEPIDDYLPTMHQMTDTHSHLLGFSRCGSSADSHPTSTPARRSRSSQEGMLKCHYCPKKYGSQVLLDGHMRECQLIRMHECLQCQKRFKARGGLQQHMRIHNNDRPYACHFCAKRFTQKSHVDQHERIHTGAKPFSCQYCGRAFRQRSQQLGHEATHIHAAQENRSVELPKVSLPSDDIIHQQRLLPPPSSGANPAVTGLLALSQQHQQQHQQHLNHQQMLSLGQGHHHPMVPMPDFSHPSLMLNQMM